MVERAYTQILGASNDFVGGHIDLIIFPGLDCADAGQEHSNETIFRLQEFPGC